LILLAAAASAAALAGGQPPPEPAVEPTARKPIVVAGKPISRGWLRHWAEIAAASGVSAGQRRPQVAQLLISSHWLKGEAAERGIELNRSEVTRALRRQRRQSFKTRRDFRRFLRDSGQTTNDVRFRVSIDLLSTRLRAAATEGAATPEEEQARLDEFVVAFGRKWSARTACRRPWFSEFECGARSAPR
jgi:hypothetical protein